jgi:hypothetical protein
MFVMRRVNSSDDGYMGEMNSAVTFNYKQVLLAILLVGAKVLSLGVILY